MTLPVKPPDGYPCTLCQLGSQPHVRNTCIPARYAGKLSPADGSNTGIALLVGEAPGSNENIRGLPFVGVSGDLLERAIKALKLDLGSVVFTNAVRCQPSGNANPPVTAKRACKPFLDQEVEELQPEVIVLLGAQALNSLFPDQKGGVEKNRRVQLEYLGVPTFVTYHPAYIKRNPAKGIDFLEDLKEYLVTQSWKDEEPEPLPVQLVTTPKAFLHVRGLVEASDKISLDLEWDTDTYEITLFSVGIDGCAYVIPVHHPESELSPQLGLQLLADIGASNKVVQGHSLIADLGMVRRTTGQHINCLADDSLMYDYQLSEHGGNRKLEMLAKRFAGPYRKLEQPATGSSLPQEARYCGVDSLLPPLIIRGLQKELERRGYWSDNMVEFNRRLIRYLSTMAGSGIQVDIEELNKVREKRANEIIHLQERLDQLSNGVNLDSPKQLSAYLYGNNSGLSEREVESCLPTGSTPLGLSVPNVHNNRGKSYARTADHVISEIEDVEFTTLLKQYRSATKVYRTYVEGIDKNLYLDGKVYPDIFPASQWDEFKSQAGGTTSGRLSFKNPPLQTLDKDSDIIRVFVSRHVDGVLVGLDGSQMELRWGAFESQDPTLLEIFASGKDPHQATADLCNTDRATGKTANFLCIYGGSAKKLSQEGIPPQLARKVVSELSRAWETLYDFEKGVAYEIIRRGETSTPYGRFRRLPGVTSPYSHDALAGINFKFQAVASDICQLLGDEITLRSQGTMIPILTEHDGLYWDVKESDLSDALDNIGACVLSLPTLLEQVLSIRNLNIPFVFEAKVGPNLGEMSKIKEFTTEGD